MKLNLFLISLFGLMAHSPCHSLEEEFKNYLVTSKFNDFFELPPQKRDLELQKQKIATLEKIRDTAQTITFEKDKTALTDVINSLIEYSKKGYWLVQKNVLTDLRSYLYSTTNPDWNEIKKVIKIFYKLENAYAKNLTQNLFTTPLAMTYGALEVRKNELPRLYNFLGEICAAHKINTPTIYIGKSGLLQIFGIPENINKKGIKDTVPTIYLDDEFFKILTEGELQAVLAHEVAHFVYNDTNRFRRLDNNGKVLMNHWREYRADLFAAQCGFGPSFAEGEKKIINEVIKRKIYSAEQFNNNPSHPSPEKRIAALRELPSSPGEILFDPQFHNKQLTFLQRKQPDALVNRKIISSSAQPLKIAQITALAVQAAKRLPK